MQVTPEYEEATEFKMLAKEIVKKHDVKFAGIDLELIKAVMIVNKDRSESNDKYYDIITVKEPVRSDCPFAFYIVIYQSDWEGFDKKHKLLLISKALCAIPLDSDGEMEEGCVNSPDMKDFATMLRTFGPDYLIKDDVPDILLDDIKWKD